MLNGLDLFSGIGGLSIALSEWVRPVAYCEIDPYCQAVLLNKMDRSEITRAPIWDDIRTLNRESGDFPFGSFDIVYGGFPCQDISVAGRGKGLEGERSGLFFEIVRLAKEIKPKFIFLENVPAITSRGGITVVRTLAEMGYDCRWCVISAASIGALHRRERWFLLAHSLCSGRGQDIRTAHGDESKDEKKHLLKSIGTCTDVADSLRERLPFRSTNQPETKPIEHESWWAIEPNVGRVAHGVPQRVDKIRALGNAVVPQQAEEAFKILMGFK